MPFKFPAYAKPLFDPRRYKALHGGRGGAKTTTIARILVLLGSQKTLNIFCGREFQNSMEESVKPAIEKAIKDAGLLDFFDIQEKKIVGINGTLFRFKGLSRNIYSIKGLEDVDIFWVEEANTLSAKSLELLRPSIRKPGSEIWFSWNRHDRSDAVDEMFLGGGTIPNAYVQQVNFPDNPFFTQELEDERLLCLENEPQRYKHIWLGEPDDNSQDKIILPFPWLLKAVDAHIELGIDITGTYTSGLDVADTGSDKNCWSLMKGPLLEDVKEWQVPYLYQTSARAHRLNTENGVTRMYYDATGLGSGIKSDMAKLKNKRRYKAKPFLFGGAIEGKETLYMPRIKNKDYFARKNIQAGWNIRMRLQNTLKLINGEDIAPEKCFFINGKIENINAVLKELSQPLYDEDGSGKIKVIKTPDGEVSPNAYDSVIMAKAYDIRNGLKAYA